MDEISNSLKEYERPEKERIVFAARDWIALALALALAALYRNVFFLDSVVMTLAENYGYSPGLGVTAFVFALFAAVFAVLGKRARITFQSVLLTCASLILSLCCFLFANCAMTIINCFVILAIGAMAVFSLSGTLEGTWRQASVILETVKLSFLALFTNTVKPFMALSSLGGSKKALKGVIAGVAICLPVLLIVVSLLASADAVFASLMGGIAVWLSERGALNITFSIVRTLIVTLFFFSALYFLCRPRENSGAKPRREALCAPALPAVSALIMLDIVYAVFVFIQFAFLFGGESAAVIRGGYAEYARSGFFQLVAVAAINLAAVLICTTLCLQNAGKKKSVRGKTALRIFSGILLLFTAVILASALYRMCLYISVYGLSMLRVLTLWAMAVILAGIIALTLKLARPDFKFFQVFFAFTLSSWIVLNLLNSGAVIANYNVDAYLNGKTAQIDVAYLASLSPDTFPALERLYEQSPESFSRPLERMKGEIYTHPAWSTWKYAYRHLTSNTP